MSASKAAQEPEEPQIYPCHKCGEAIEGDLYAMMLPTQVRRPTPDDASRYVTTRYQFCVQCLCQYAYAYLTGMGIERFLAESQGWEHPTGSVEVVRINLHDTDAEALAKMAEFNEKFAEAERRIEERGMPRRTSGRIV